MPSPSRRIPEGQRELLRQRHEAELSALAAHASAVERLAGAEAHRADVVADQDRHIAAARRSLAEASRSLADLVGVAAVAGLVGVPVAQLRRELRHVDVEP